LIGFAALIWFFQPETLSGKPVPIR